jgi:hypothetical protein
VGSQNGWFPGPITHPGALYRPEWITAFLNQFREKYRTVEDYVKNQVGLSDEDVERIRVNLLVPKAVPN